MAKPSSRLVRRTANSARSFVSKEVEPYESKLGRDPEWAMSEGSKFFEGKSGVQATLDQITATLRELSISYVVVGGMAMFKYGYRRFTEVIDLLVTREGLKAIHEKLDGRGYLPPFPGSKNLRDTEHGVRIEFLLTGDFPGDGKPKPVSFPDRAAVSCELDGIRYVNLPTLIELKLASGMTNPGRIRDSADVLELIKAADLPLDFADKLNPFVQNEYKRLWKDAHPPAKRYIARWPTEWLTADAKSEHLKARLADGVTLDPDSGKADDYAYLVTTDPNIARKYDMHDENEFWSEDAGKKDEKDTSGQGGDANPPD